MSNNNHGGYRKGAGRPQGAYNKPKPVVIDNEIVEAVKNKYPVMVEEITADYLEHLNGLLFKKKRRNEYCLLEKKTEQDYSLRIFGSGDQNEKIEKLENQFLFNAKMYIGKPDELKTTLKCMV